jgi:hypothetical protein
MRAQVILQRGILGVIVAVALLYAGDYLWARHVTAGANPAGLGTVMVHHEWDVPQKDGRVEFDLDPPVAETCVHSIFPHFGFAPCWYAARHTTTTN